MRWHSSPSIHVGWKSVSWKTLTNGFWSVSRSRVRLDFGCDQLGGSLVIASLLHSFVLRLKRTSCDISAGSGSDCTHRFDHRGLIFYLLSIVYSGWVQKGHSVYLCSSLFIYFPLKSISWSFSAGPLQTHFTSLLYFKDLYVNSV